MKYFIPQLFLTTACFLSATLSQADSSETTKFSVPAEYCFPQTSLRGGFDRIILDHHVIIPPEHHFKIGDVFVGARFKSKPNVLWLTNGSSWWNVNDDTVGPKSYASGQLQPVIPTSISYDPIDVSAFIGDGEIWVGYGLRSEAESWREALDEMKRNQRFNILWEIGVPSFPFPSAGLHSLLPNICLTSTQMTTTISTLDTMPIPNKTGLDIETIPEATKP